MKKVNFYVTLKGLDGEALTDVGEKEILVSETLSNILVQSRASKAPVRLLTLATTIYKSKGEIDIEDADITLIKDVVKKSEASTLLAGTILRILGDK